MKYPESVRLPHWPHDKKSNKGSSEALNAATSNPNIANGTITGTIDGEAAGRPSISESHHTNPVAVSSDGHLLPAPQGPEGEEEDGDEEVEEPQISVLAATVLLIGVTVLVAFTAEFLVDSINGLVETSPLSQEWVSSLLLRAWYLFPGAT